MADQNKIKYFRRERLFFKIGGISLDAQESLPYKIYSRIVLLFVFIVYPVMIFADLFSRDFNESLKEWFYGLVTLMDCTILINIFCIRKSYQRALMAFERSSFHANKSRGRYDEEKKMLQDWLAISTRLVRGASIMFDDNQQVNVLELHLCYTSLSNLWQSNLVQHRLAYHKVGS
ncbi:uncharacterized protein LOC116164458 [Photinus pyralis]|uniref:uncharacterized protein LOC116164458 n=1 Tax=Photinus pyralis TaxID=7054 RepID=UPI00126744B2|nr:uncharacterized protein LOC116164458 [Photinus pyralis]